jgi:hypothetical protein
MRHFLITYFDWERELRTLEIHQHSIPTMHEAEDKCRQRDAMFSKIIAMSEFGMPPTLLLNQDG